MPADGAAAHQPEVEVRRSARRRRTVSAYEREGRIVVMIPATFTREQEEASVRDLVARLQRKRGLRDRSDEALWERARQLNRTYLDGRAEPDEIRWVGTMTSRWASCTSATRTIRVSDRLQDVPDWVLDYVLVHELAHLLQPDHSPAFWAWVDRYPRSERAKGFLEGLTHVAR